MKNEKKTCWIITEDLIGTQNQCIGVAQALDIAYEVKTISLKQPWKAFSPYLGLECKHTFSQQLTPPWPDILITSGRKAIAASRYIKRKSKGKTFTLHIQDPRIPSTNFDIVAVPAHDPMRGDNVIVTIAAPNKITDKALNEAANTWEKHFSGIKKPRATVMIGGNSKAHSLTPQIMQRLCAQLKELSTDYGLMITTSRRTGIENESILRSALKDTDAYIWDNTGENPYLGMLALADFILVTEDSTSMLSDAATTGKPTYIIALEGGGKRLSQLHANLKEHGALRDFTGALEHWEYPALNDAQMIADFVRQKLDQR